MRLALARRKARPPDAEPLPPIRSLHYFMPVIDEMPPGLPPEGYLGYFRDAIPDNNQVAPTITSPNGRKNDRAPRHTSRQLQLPLDLGARPEKDVSS